jgi:hypothetical protein
MSVQIGAAPKTSKRMRLLKKGNLAADGTEQVLVEFEGEGKLYGSLDLHEMTVGDTVIVRQYIKLLPESDYEKYAEETYEEVQDMPVIYFPDKATDVAMKITLEQTEGVYRRFRCSFMVED